MKTDKHFTVRHIDKSTIKFVEVDKLIIDEFYCNANGDEIFQFKVKDDIGYYFKEVSTPGGYLESKTHPGLVGFNDRYLPNYDFKLRKAS
jgi:hypothetical protein